MVGASTFPSTPGNPINVPNLVIATCKELGIAVVAYSYGLLSPSSPPPNPLTARLIVGHSPIIPRTVCTLKAILGARSALSEMM
jgi:hypothetical protein